MPTPSTLTMEEKSNVFSVASVKSEGSDLLTIIPIKDFMDMKNSLKENYTVGFVDGIIASSAAYLIITLIALFIGSYYQ